MRGIFGAIFQIREDFFHDFNNIEISNIIFGKILKLEKLSSWKNSKVGKILKLEKFSRFKIKMIYLNTGE